MVPGGELAQRGGGPGPSPGLSAGVVKAAASTAVVYQWCALGLSPQEHPASFLGFVWTRGPSNPDQGQGLGEESVALRGSL